MNRTLTGRHVLLTLVGTFGVVIAVNAYFVTRAVETYPGEDVQNPYLQGVDYNQTLARHAEQSATDWTATIGASRRTDGAAEITVAIDSHGKPLPQGFAVSGILRHPADAERDQPLRFQASGPNTFAARLANVDRGAWDVSLSASGAPFEASRRIWLP